jgi:hypothetical protein
MSTYLPEPLPLFWQLKPVSSARAGVEVLNDGRRKYWIKHDVLKNVTPRMLAWWFGHMEGDVEIQGQQFPRYQADFAWLFHSSHRPDGGLLPKLNLEIHQGVGQIR